MNALGIPDLEAFRPHAAAGLVPARIVASYGERVRAAFDTEETLATLAGRLRHESVTCTVGDWVALQLTAGQSVIQAVLPRKTELRRAAAGGTTQVQVLAANVDTALIVSGLDHDFNLRRLERYLVMAWEGGVTPVVVLNKADLCDRASEREAEATATFPGVAVLRISAATGDGVAALSPWLGAGQTLVALGSSGVGKSTLTNRLLGEAHQRTREVRANDSHGRHTTSHREMLPLPGGALLIDTPGLREVQLWAADGAGEAFSDVTALAGACRFRDCTHGEEPGCAVRAAVWDGTLDADRLENWRKLSRELRHQASRQHVQVRLAEKKRWKAITKAMRERRPWE